jgi:hypothetical protein
MTLSSESASGCDQQAQNYVAFLENAGAPRLAFAVMELRSEVNLGGKQSAVL